MGIPALSVVVPCSASDQSRLIRLLKSIDRQAGARSLDVIVVFNPPVQHDLLSSEFPTVRFFNSEKIGVNAARNRGARAALANLILFLDADCELSGTEFFDRLFSQVQNISGKFILGGNYEQRPVGRLAEAYALEQSRWFMSGPHSQHGWIHFFGGSLLLPKAAFDDFAFDETIVFGGSETELIARLLKSGYQGRCLRELEVIHHIQLSWLSFLVKTYYQGIGAERILNRGLRIEPERQSFLSPDIAETRKFELGLYRRIFWYARRHFDYREESLTAQTILSRLVRGAFRRQAKDGTQSDKIWLSALKNLVCIRSKGRFSFIK